MVGVKIKKESLEHKFEIFDQAPVEPDYLRSQQTYNDEKPLQCAKCNKIYKTLGQLKKHKYRCPPPPKLILKCDDCEEEFLGQYYLYKHMRDNHTVMPQCSICEKVLSDKKALKKHIKFVHQKIKSYECSICCKRFVSITLTERHKKQVHERIKNFECSLCHKKFPQAQNLEWHMRGVHEKLKPYQCDICGMNFAQSASLSTHYKNIHQKKKEII